MLPAVYPNDSLLASFVFSTDNPLQQLMRETAGKDKTLKGLQNLGLYDKRFI